MSISNYYREAAGPASTPKHRSRARRKRLLVVEDDRLSLKVLRQLLAARGYDVLQASGGWDAISRARHEQPDLIVMDLRLPDISGLDATRLLKKNDQTKNIPIIAVTAFVTPSFEATAFENGCDAYIAKPINIENLLQTVESMLRARAANDPTLNDEAGFPRQFLQRRLRLEAKHSDRPGDRKLNQIR